MDCAKETSRFRDFTRGFGLTRIALAQIYRLREWYARANAGTGW